MFQGGGITSSGPTQGGNSKVDASSSDYVVVEVDLDVEFNENTLASSTERGSVKNSTLSDLLLPGQLMMVTGKDQNGADYTSCDILVPETSPEEASGFSNGDWDYNVMQSPLPAMSQTKSGSILLKVSPTVSELKLVIITANGNTDPLNPESVKSGNKKIYYLEL